MNDAIKFLNSLGFGAFAAILSIISGLVAAIIGIYKSYNQIKKVLNDIIKKHKERQESALRLEKKLDNIGTKVNSLENHVSEMKSQSEKSQKDTNRKIDELWDTVLQGQKTDASDKKLLTMKLSETNNQVDRITRIVESLNEKTSLLITSDKDSIKSVIIDKYYQALRDGYIEVRVLDNIEKSYEIYIQENGNTFIESLMQKLRKMPNEPPNDITQNLPTDNDIKSTDTTNDKNI